MDHTHLRKIVNLDRVDRHSVDSLMRSMSAQDGFTIERLFLKTESSPSPSEDRFDNVPCVLIQSTDTTHRAAVLYIHGGREVTLEDPPWVREVAGGGLVVGGITLPMGDPLASAVAKVLKGVSYLDLRRDLVDHGVIVVWSQGDSGVSGLVAAVLDDRVAGVVAQDLPLEVSLRDGVTVETSAICGLLPPKRLLLVGYKDLEAGVREVIEAYQQGGRGDNVRFEDKVGRGGAMYLLNWVRERRGG